VWTLDLLKLRYHSIYVFGPDLGSHKFIQVKSKVPIFGYRRERLFGEGEIDIDSFYMKDIKEKVGKGLLSVSKIMIVDHEKTI